MAIAAGGVAAEGIVDVLHALWLLTALSVVYAATRHEPVVAILDHFWRFGAKVAAVLVAPQAVLIWISWRL